MKKKNKIVRVVTMEKMFDMEGFAIKSPDGDLDKFYPARLREPENLGASSTAETSTEFFRFISFLQRSGVEVVFSI